MPSQDSVKEELLKTHDEFRRLHDEHQRFERRLARLHQRSQLSSDDELEEKRIKRHKLFLKDRMQEILRSHQDKRVSV